MNDDLQGKIKKLQQEINQDLKIDKSKLDIESSENPILFQKYLDLYYAELTKLSSIQKEHDQLKKKKLIFYKTEFKLIPETQSEMNVLLDGDKDFSEIKQTLSEQNAFVNYLSKTVDNFNNRGWAIKNTLDFLVYTKGAAL